mgnify:FL=1|jgi:hypothetical protein
MGKPKFKRNVSANMKYVSGRSRQFEAQYKRMDSYPELVLVRRQSLECMDGKAQSDRLVLMGAIDMSAVLCWIFTVPPHQVKERMNSAG